MTVRRAAGPRRRVLPPARRADHARRRRDDVVPRHPAGDRAGRGAGRVDDQRDPRAGDRLHAARGARRARLDAGRARAAVRRGGARARRLDVAHPVRPHPAQHRLADPGAGDVHLRLRGAGRGGPVVPRRRRAARAADLGHDDRQRPAVRAPGDLDRRVSRASRSSSPRCRCRWWATACATCSIRSCGRRCDRCRIARSAPRCCRSGTCGRTSSPTPALVKAVEDVSFTLDAGRDARRRRRIRLRQVGDEPVDHGTDCRLRRGASSAARSCFARATARSSISRSCRPRRCAGCAAATSR